MKPVITAIVFFLMNSYVIYGQQIILRGEVIDELTKEVIIGATLAEYNSDGRVVNGAITDVYGRFTIAAKDSKNTLQVSYIGYEKKVIPINNQTNIVIRLKPESIQMDEVVIVAKNTNPLTGLSQEDEGGASSTTILSDIEQIGASSSADALQGMVSGLDIIASSGNPGSGSQLVIRGLGSLGNAKPLIVVDGIPRNTSIGDLDLSSADQEDIGSLINVAPQDIRSITVLKDAASTAVWGSTGANGVLLIETIKGDKGNISYFYNYQTSVNIQPASIPMLNGDEYITMQLEELFNEQGVFPVPDELAYDRDYYNFNNYNKNTDWLDAITRTGLKSEHYFKVSGGGDKTLFFTSLRYLKDKGTTINTDFDQLSTRVNLNYSLSSKLRFTVNFDYSNSLKGDNVQLKSSNVDLVTAYDGPDDTNNWINIRKMAYVKAPNMSIYEYNENGELTGEYFNPIDSYQGKGDEFFNPVAIGNLSTNDTKRNIIQNSFKLNYKVFDWMDLIETVSFSYQNTKINEFIPYSAIGADWLDDQINNAKERNSVNNTLLSRTQLFIQPLKKVKNHFLSGVFLWEIEQDSYENITLTGAKSASLNISDPAVNSPIVSFYSNSGIDRKIGALSNVNYKFRDTYVLAFNLRADASSIFGANNRMALFPSASFAWKMEQEEWLKNMSFVNQSKLRLSWGRSGNTMGNSITRFGLYNTEGQYIQDVTIEQTQVQLSNFKWETKESWNIGLDLGLFKNRLEVTFDVYDAVTSNLLWKNYEIPASSGYATLKYYNGGSIQNKGWELFINSTIVRTRDINLSLKFNISHNSNRFISFPENFNSERSLNVGNGDYPRRATIDQPVGSFYGFKYLGVWASDEDVIATDENGYELLDLNGKPLPVMYKDEYEFQGGDAKYEDVNHDGIIDINDAVFLGDGNPDFMGGFGTAFKYKQFKFSTQFHYRLGFDIVNEIALQTEG
ncbi:MAG: SusC/RagA family TonB-linked outer membrane protein, partial [Bacteroidales bacterium]|nr:SusC/RagA family TonB-linked outer membrane protein [Bacteroidales bacterium]